VRGRRLKQVGADKRSIKLNKDHEPADLTSMEIIVTVQVWQAGVDGIQRDH
jgi:hypothetical protein